VTGLGETARSRQAVPALASVSLDRSEMGWTAMALAAVGPARRSLASRVVPYHLVERESAAPPRRVGGRRPAS